VPFLAPDSAGIRGLRVLLVSDAPTREAQGSVTSLQAVRNSLLALGAAVEVVSLFSSSLIDSLKSTDLLFLTTHGLCGEDGSLTALAEQLGIPVTGPATSVHALCLNKVVFKVYAQSLGIGVVPFLAVMSEAELSPFVLKPVAGGGSQDIVFVGSPPGHLQSPVVPHFAEQYIEGRFVTCAAFPFLGEHLPLLEIQHSGPVYTYAAKRNAQLRRELCPADLDRFTEDAIYAASAALYLSMGAEGPLRFDFLVADEHSWLLEANTVPGMSRFGNLAKIANAAAWSHDHLVAAVALDAVHRAR
jgi:D-alanine-D-alanine ligase